MGGAHWAVKLDALIESIALTFAGCMSPSCPYMLHRYGMK